MIKFENIWTDSNKYLEDNPDFTKQLLITLNQANFDPYSIFFTTDNSEKKNSLRIWWNKNFCIQSLNPEDLLEKGYYEKLMSLKNNRLQYWQTTYHPNELLVEKCTLDPTFDNFKLISIGVKLDQPIDKYHNEQVKAIGCFIDETIKLICKNRFMTINSNLFINNYLKHYHNADESTIIITFALKDFANPLIQRDSTNNTMRTTESIRDKLKDVLKPESKLSKYLSTHDLVDQLNALL